MCIAPICTFACASEVLPSMKNWDSSTTPRGALAKWSMAKWANTASGSSNVRNAHDWVRQTNSCEGKEKLRTCLHTCGAKCALIFFSTQKYQSKWHNPISTTVQFCTFVACVAWPWLPLNIWQELSEGMSVTMNVWIYVSLLAAPEGK